MTDSNPSSPNAISSADRPEAGPPVKRKRRGRGLLVLVALVVIIGAGGAVAYKFRRLFQAPPAPVVIAAPVPMPVPRIQPRSPAAASVSPNIAPELASSAQTKSAPTNNGSAPTPSAAPTSADTTIPGSARAVPANPDAAKIAAMQTQIAQLSATVLADHADMVRLQASAASLPRLAARAHIMAVLAAASMALQSGQPLGTIPNAPEALVRYASVAPPTEASLRAEFAALAPSAAQQAGMTNNGVTGLWARLRAHVVDLISLRRGDRVLIGSRADGAIVTARRDLALGDLSGAVAAVKTLPAPALSVLQPWIDQADHLLAARAAMVQMTEQH